MHTLDEKQRKNKVQPELKHKLTIYRHYKNVYSDEKDSKRRERKREGNEERQKVGKKKDRIK